MNRVSIFIGALLGAFTALVIIALDSLGSLLLGTPQSAFTLFDGLTRILPGRIVTFSIDTMVALINRLGLGPTASTAKTIEHGIAIIIFLILGAIFGILLAVWSRRFPTRLVQRGQMLSAILALVLIFALVLLGYPSAGPILSTIWIAVVIVLWGTILARWIEILAQPVPASPADASRRQFLTLVGVGSFTILVSAAAASLLSRPKSTTSTSQIPVTAPTVDTGITSGPAQSPSESDLANRIPAVNGTRPELTSNDKFYRIDIDSFPPHVNADAWRLEVAGLVNNPMSLSLNDIRSRPAFSQVITLECISNDLGGDLISTSLWTGIRLKDLLADAGLQPSVQEIAIQSFDDYYESVPLSEAMDDRTLLVYEMNGEPLPTEHGFPLRIYIPNHFGMKQPKWIERLEAIDHPGAGYWVDRGWNKTAVPPTTSVIDTVDINDYDAQTGIVPIGGIAYAGARGIRKVEVQVDDGAWQDVQLRNPPLSPLTWVQWRYDWKSATGLHIFHVRAYDGTGALQETQSAPPSPAGATGIFTTRETTP